MKPKTPRTLLRMQDGLVRLLGNDVEGRTPLVAAMLHRDATEATSYWLQLVVSVGIATLGLVVGSSAVIIGAMLVAPLMGPIVGLAMGLATGSPFLVLRSAGRIAFSIGVAVGGAALITTMLPFHELNAEISARTSPTALDLVTAGFCAIAGVYASLRPGTDTATTAAGTSISISLVPPLCASGYGIGTGAGPVAAGAGLLFLTNLVAIVAVGTVAFVAAGFNRVDVVALEHTALALEGESPTIARAMARKLSTLFESRMGPALRFLMPFLLLAAVYVPLRRALNEVAWEVRVRAAVRDVLAQEPSVFQSRARIERHSVEVVAVLLGNTADAERAHARLDAAIRRVADVAPRIEVLAVPDATAFAGLESTLLKPSLAPEPPAAPTASPDEQLDSSRSRVRSAITELWPTTTSGEPLVVDLGTGEAGPLRIRVVHLGPPLGAAGTEALRRAVDSKLGRDAEIVDVAVPALALTRDDGDLAFLAAVASGIRATAGVPIVDVCVVRPPEAKGSRKPTPRDEELARSLDDALARHPRLTITTGEAWSVRFVRGPCAPPADGATGNADAGPPR